MMRYGGISTAVVLAALVVCGSANAAIITYQLDTDIDGGTSPAGVAPWLTVTIDDGGTSGSVTLAMTDTNLSGNEHVVQWLFNLEPSFTLANLVFSAPTKTGTFVDPIISTATDSFAATGDGSFDIQFAFNTSNGPNNKFGVGEAVSYTITSTDAIVATSFNRVSAGGSRPTAAEISVGGYVGAPLPEPATLALMGLGGLMMLRRRRVA